MSIFAKKMSDLSLRMRSIPDGIYKEIGWFCLENKKSFGGKKFNLFRRWEDCRHIKNSAERNITILCTDEHGLDNRRLVIYWNDGYPSNNSTYQGKIIEVNYKNKTYSIGIYINNSPVWPLLEVDDHKLKDIGRFIISDRNDFFPREELKEQKKAIEDAKMRALEKSQIEALAELDKDGNGVVDIIEGDDFSKLVGFHQKKIIEIDRSYIQQFVKVANFIKTKKANIQTTFAGIKDTTSMDQLDKSIQLLKEQIESYHLLTFHSINMITCLVTDDMVPFYEIYESFDKLKIFNSNHENEVSDRLKNIEKGIYDLMLSLQAFEQNIISELQNLSYITQSSIEHLSVSVNDQLRSINSALDFNAIIGGIQVYQLHKIGKNLKKLQ